MEFPEQSPLIKAIRPPQPRPAPPPPSHIWKSELISPRNSVVPMVIKQEGGRESAMDIFSMLLTYRIVMLEEDVNRVTASLIKAQMLYLAQQSEEEIKFWINSPGGSVHDGFAIYDTMRYLMKKGIVISTYCFGIAASMGAFLFIAGTKGHRSISPLSEVMIHQPMGGTEGQSSDMELSVKHMVRTRTSLYSEMAKNTGQPFEKIEKDCDRDNWFTAEDAITYGMADRIVEV